MGTWNGLASNGVMMKNMVINNMCFLFDLGIDRVLYRALARLRLQVNRICENVSTTCMNVQM